MKKPTNSKFILATIFLLFSIGVFSQVLKPFGKEYDANIKGDILVVGNNILNRDFGTAGNRANDSYNTTGSSSVYNESINMKWINIDPDGGNNFNSSSAKLTIPAASKACYKIAYAALYWSGTYSIAADRGSASGADRSVINKVRFKVGTNPYVNLTGKVIYDYIGTGAPAIPQNVPATAQAARNPYACMVDVTSIIQSGGEVDYTVANIASSEGGSGTSAGHSAGWSLFVVYEDPKLSGKYITSYNGFTRIRGGDPAFTFPINGFRTIPSGPVKTKLAFATLEGDNRDASDYMRIVGSTIGGSVSERLFTPTVRPDIPNFFNSSINDLDTHFLNRVPASRNTLGFDTGVIDLINPSNNTIKNGEQSANITLGTGADWYYMFFTALSIETIEPEIILTKRVLNDSRVDIGGANVTFNDVLNYVIRFQNVGNDNAQNFTIEDTLPINVIFNYPADILPLPAGVTVKSYNPATRLLIFDIDKGLVEKNDPYVEFELKVKVVAGCNDLSNVCSNSIDNIAVAKYTGTIDPDSGTVLSINSNDQCVLEPKATNFLVGVDGCIYATDVTLCAESLVLTAGNGYDKYAWSKFPFDAMGNASGPILATSQSYTATDIGTYYVYNTAIAPCRSITQQFNVTRFGGVVNNPVSNFADEIVQCANNGKLLPNIYLCGGTDFRDILTGISGTTSIVWQRLTGGCTTTTNPTCASESASCTWSTVANGPDYRADTAGEYRLILNYSGGCFNLFYFNVYKNNFTPTALATDIFCNTPGTIIVNNPAQATGYEYSLNENGPFVATNTFTINAAGIYTAYVRQVGVPTNPCIFKVENLQIIDRKISIQEIIQQPNCKGDKGTITLNVNGVRGQYYLSLRKGAAVIVSPLPQTSNQFVISNLDIGTYDYTVTTNDGCNITGSIVITEPQLLTASAALTKPITCVDGEITVTPLGGTSPYVYYVNGATTFQSTLTNYIVTRPLPTGGVFNIEVVDKNNCKTTTSIIVTDNPKPLYTVSQTNILCYGTNTGAINFNVTNANGYTLSYSIDNGTTYVSSSTFSNLAPGTYTPILRYTLAGVDCFETQPAITITQPDAAVTASMGVSELAGCGPAREGKVRITNPQGGVSPYQYSFDNQATWITVNDAYKAPGTYTLYVRDANNCIFSGTVTIDPEPPTPILDVATPVDFNCDGTATSTVTIDNPGGISYTYDYYLDGVINPNTPSNVFLNVTPGSHAIKVEYKLNSVTTFSNLLFEDFGKGTFTTTPGINPAYCFEDEATTHLDPAYKCNKDEWINDGEYAVASSIRTNFGGAWITNPKDHTVPSDPIGRFLCVNVGGTAGIGGVLYSKPISNVIPNQDVKVSIWALNLIVASRPLLGDPDLTIQLWKDYGLPSAVQVGNSVNTGSIPKSQKWENYNLTINPGNNTNLTFLVRSNSTIINGNDVLIDDINVYQLPKTCISTKDFTIVVPTGKAFSAQIAGTKDVTCAGLTNGEMTIAVQNFEAAGFEYSINNGSTWTTSTTSPVIITGLGNALYKVVIRPVGSTIVACAKPFDVTINAPAAVTASATVTTQATCTTGATITAVGGGGTPAYQYQLENTTGTVLVAYNTNPAFTNIVAGNYIVFVRDANNCTNSVGVPVNVVSPPTLSATLTGTTDYCYTTANPATLDVSVTGGTGPFTYKLDGNAAISSATTTFSFANVAPGTHTIIVTDSNNCTTTISNIVIAPQIGFAVSLLNDLTCLVDASIGNPIITNGNGAPYTYTVSHNSGTATTVTSFPYIATLAGTYVFTVTDSRGCTAVSNTITVTAKTTPTITTTKTDISCNNANDGRITVTASGGFTSSYTYAIKLSSAATYTTQATNLFTGLNAGTYNVKVIDSKGCESAVSNVVIINPTVVTATIAATDISCSTTGTVSAVVTVTSSGGTGTLQYSFNGTTNFTPTNTYSTAVAGIVTAYVRDANNCQIGPLSIPIVAPEQFTSMTITDSGWDCATTPAGGHVNIAGIGVSSPKRYSIISGPAGFDPTENADGEFKGLAPGAYIFQVRDTKTNCTLTRSYTINGTPDVIAGGSVTTPILCFGNLGAIQFTVGGLNGHRYDYVVTNTAGTTVSSANNQSAPTISLTNLPASAYTIIVTDRTTKCTATYTINLSQPTAALAITSAIATNVNCNNDNSQITVTATGGTTNYTYAYLVAGSTATPTYAPGNVLNIDTTNGTVLAWDIYVKDANGCIAKTTVTVISDVLPTITVVVDNQCSASGSAFTITATGTGLAPLTYGIGGPTGAFQASPTFTVPAGTYTVSIKDKNGCIVAAPAPTTVYPQLTAVSSVTKSLDCSASPNAVISGTISGGRSPFTIVVLVGTGPGTISQPTSTTFSYSTAVASAYTFQITDANGCQTTVSSTINPITNPTVTLTPTHVSCNGGANGSVSLVGAGGSGGYEYSFNGIAFSATTTYTNLSAGIAYPYQVRDSKGCVSAAATITLTQPTALLVSASATAFSCSVSNVKQSAVVTIAVPTTGTSPYEYSFNGGAYSSIRTLTVNDNGTDQTINYSVKDAKGCITPGSLIINRLNPPTDLTFTPSGAITCTTTSVAVQLATANGVLPLSYLIASGPVTNTSGATTGNFTGLTPGTYVFRVTDDRGCYYSESHTIAPVTPIAVSAAKLTDVDCFGSNTGSARFTVTGFSSTGNYTISVTSVPAALPFSTTTVGDVHTLTGLVTGTYTFSVTDNTTGCADNKPVTINQPAAAISLNLMSNKNANCNIATSRVEVLAAGGTPNYTYAFMQDGVAPLAANYTASAIANLNPITNTNWDVWVKDAKGCTIKLDVAIATDPLPSVTASATAQCLGVGSYTITAVGSGGVGVLNYSINNGASYQLGTTFVVTTSGNYTIKVKDANGCTADSNVINVAPQLTLNAVLNKDITCVVGDEPARITVTPSGGSGSFNYAITTPASEASNVTGAITGVFTTSVPGNYTFTVTDTTTGCTYTTTTAIPVTAPVNPVIDDVALPGNIGVTQTAFINCNGDDTAAIAIAIDNTKGQSPFVFNIRQYSDPAHTILVQNFGTQTSGLPAGYYVVTVTDAKGCTDSEAITITEPNGIVVTSTSTPITCNGAGISKGSVIVQSVTGGVGPYNYFVTGVNGYNNSELNNLGTTSVAFNVVDFGIYQINVVDSNGCSVLIQNVIVASPPDDLDISVIPPPADCSAPGSAIVAVGSSPTSTIGTGPFYFSLYTGIAPIYPAGTWLAEDGPGSKQTTFTNLIPGVTYTFVVFDADVANGGTGTGCYYYETSTIPIPTNSTITVNPLTPNNITCRGAGDGNVTFTLNQSYGVATPVTYQIYNSQSVTPVGAAVAAVIPATGSLVVNSFGTLPFGSYFVLVTETAGATNAGCSITSARFDITESAIDLSVIATKIKNVNCNEEGVITAQAKDGTAPYTYQYLLATDPAPTALTAGWISATTFATSTTGNYVVYVKDAYGCIKNAPVTLVADALPTITAPLAPICYDGTAFTITVTGTVDPAIVGGATYSINGSAFQNSPSFTFNSAGTYNLVIKDGNGCTDDVDFIVHSKLELSAAVTKALDCTATPEAIITLTATGGNPTPAPNYTFEVNFNGGGFVAAVNPYTAVTAGTYVFRITDANNATLCQTITSIVVDPLVPILPVATVSIPLCVGDNANVEINATGGTGIYEFKKGLAGVYSSSNIFAQTALEGTITYYVKDSKDCEFTVDATIVDPVALGVPTIAVTPLTCGIGNIANVATITVTASGGAGGYQYSFDNGTTYTSSNSINTAIAGTYEIIVKDANGCQTAMQSTIIAPLDPPTQMDITGTPVFCLPVASQTSIVTISNVQDGIGTLTYQIITPIAAMIDNGNNPVFNGLAPDTYVFQVTDANGCTYQESYTVAPVTPIAIVGALVNDISCNVANGTTNNGSASFTVTGFSSSGNYSIAVTSVPAALPFTQTVIADVINLTGLSAGTYTLTVTDLTTSCTDNDIITITLPAPIVFTATPTKVFCSQDVSTITVSGVTGGKGVYGYAVQAGGTVTPPAIYSNSPILTVDTNLTALSWDVYVQDANGCIAMQNVVITNDAPPTITVPTAQCYVGSPLTFDLNTVTTTYNGTKFYTVNGSVIATSTATFNTPGTYVLGIKDDNGCEDFVNYTIGKQLLANAVLSKDLYCAGSVNATIDVTITDGVAPYNYQMYLGGVPTGALTPVAGPTFTASVATAGSYTFVITDSNAVTCSVTTNAVVVTTPMNPTATFVQTNITCIGQTDGTITITPSNGIAPYTFGLTGIGANTTGDATGIYTGLQAGTYNFVVTDAKNCTFNDNVTITLPAPLTATAVVTPFGCNTSNVPLDAIVTISPVGGSGSYSYSFDGGVTYQASASFTVNSAQTINYVVKDANGCTVSGSAIVLPYTPPTDMDLTQGNIYCSTIPAVTSVTVNSVTGGVGPFIYEIISPASAVTAPSVPTAAPFTFTNLPAATYIIKVTDANGCSTTKAIVVEEADKINVTAQLINNVYCNGDSTGVIEFTVSNYITALNYTFNLVPNLGVMTQVGDVIRYTGVPAGSYTFTVTDGISACVASVINFGVSQPPLVLDFTTNATNINCNNDNATITVTAFGGTVDYKYAVVVSGATAPTIYGLSNQLTVDTNSGINMNWDVYVMDANGCVTFKTVTILTDVNPTIASAIHTPCVSASGTYDITVTASGFSPALQYSADGSSYQIGNVITVTAPGTYTITVKDANGCISAGTVVTILDPLILTPTVITPVSCATNDGVVSVSTTGGSGTYEYRIDSGVYPMTTPFAGLASGAHIVYVRDTTTGCEVFATITLQAATLITGFDLATTPVTCYGGFDGTITATMDTPAPGVNDNPVYTYTLTGTSITGATLNLGPQPSPLFSGLEASDVNGYTVVVTSERGCTATQSITIVEPGLINVPAPAVVQFGCTSGNTGNLATITVAGVSGGSNTFLNYEFIKIGTPNTVVQFGSNNVYTEANLSGGSYVVNVYDSKGCMGTSTTPIDIAPYIQLDKVNVNVTRAITCNNLEDIEVSVSSIGGTPANLQFTVQDVIYDNSITPPTANSGSVYNLPPVSIVGGVATFTNLPVGNYTINVRNIDTNCEIIGVHYVNEPNTFDLTIDNLVDVTCLGDTNGSARVTLIDRVITSTNLDQAGPFTYTVTGPVPSSGTATSAGPITLSNLATGTYTITATLTNTPFCIISKNFTIAGPNTALSISETHTAITCVPGNDGSISATATGGWPGGYEFELLNGATTVQAYGVISSWTGLTAGNYTVNVRDSKGCIATAGVVLINPTPIVFTATPSTILLACNNDTSASITATVPTGGQGSNYLYTLNVTSATPVINNGPQASNVFANLGAGTYTVTVTDGWGCSATSTAISITEPTKVVASLALSVTQTCNNLSTLTLSATGGTGIYQYSTTPNFALVLGSFASSTPIVVPVGTYRYYVRDANGCISVVSNDIKIDPLPILEVKLATQNAKINCRGDQTGVIVATATGGLGNYIYSLLDIAGNPVTFTPVQATPGNFTQLPAGNFMVRVDSGDCVAFSVSELIEEPLTSLTYTFSKTDVKCFGNGDGTITVNGAGGTGLIKYAITPRLDKFLETGLFTNLKPGTYTVIIQDENGCFILHDETIVEPLPINVSTVPNSIIPEVCAGDRDGAFSVAITGGVSPYVLTLDSLTGPVATGVLNQTQFDFSGIAGGDHTVYITDANKCTAEWTVSLPPSVVLDPKATVTYECVNNAPGNIVTITVDSSNTLSDVDYSIDGQLPFQTSNQFINVPSGLHVFEARHTNGCSRQLTGIFVEQVDPLTISIALGELNQIVATVTGGSGKYQFTLNGEQFSSQTKFIYFRSGEYTVTVTDTNGCVASATKYFEFIDIYIPNVFTPNGSGTNDNWRPERTENYPDIQFVVYDRYGREVGKFGSGQSWDGKYNGTELPMGDYWYVLKLKHDQDDREFIGHFTLYR